MLIMSLDNLDNRRILGPGNMARNSGHALDRNNMR